MPGPFHKSCNCRCLPPFPCIEGCADSGNFTYETVRVNMTAPTYTYTTASDSFRYNTGNAFASVYNPDITAIGPYKDLVRRPNSASFGYGQKTGTSDCQWLWNDPIAVPTKILWPNFLNCNAPFYPPPYTGSSASAGTPYEPVNSIDATSPWDRQLIANPDYDCGACYCPGCGSLSGNPRGHYLCSDVLYYSSGVLHIIEGGIPGGTPPYAYDTTHYNPFGSGYWYWLFEFKALGGVLWSYNSDSQVTRTAGATQPSFGGHVVGGVALDGRHPTITFLQYAKEIDCDTDFLGTPITLPFHLQVDSASELSYVLSTYPSSVTIELTPA